MTQAWDFIDFRILWGRRRCVSDIKIESLELTSRAQSALSYAGITTLGELVNFTESQLLRQPNCGRKTLSEIKEMLAQYGLHLKERFIISSFLNELLEDFQDTDPEK
jgi:DNA-directed RNA polymerase subunit alpha